MTTNYTTEPNVSVYGIISASNSIGRSTHQDYEVVSTCMQAIIKELQFKHKQ
jgi:hypothetical protein